jgi:molybdenum cofactor cytidylyltransferase
VRIGAVVLAAGGSGRLGQPKQLLQFGGQSLVRRAVAAALGADCAPVAVVLGAEAERLKRELVDLEIVFVPNEDWPRGIGSSIRRGVAALRDCNAIAILACDQPHVDQNVLKNLIRTQPETQKPIVACAYSATLGIPALFVRDYFDRLLSLADEEGAKALIKAQPHDVASVDFPRGAIDIDTPADYRNLADES